MNNITNIWKDPKTSLAGVLLATISIANALSQQGISLGNIGTGTIVTLTSALATALLGLLAKDPVVAPASAAVATKTVANAGTKLGTWALIALLLSYSTGCTGKTVAQEIVNWTPTLVAAVTTVDSTSALLAPEDAPIFAAATVEFDVASNLLVAQAKAYLANPSPAVLAQLQTQVVSLQQSVNVALLKAAKIKDAGSQQHALTAIQGVGTIVTAMLALVQSVSTQAQVAQMAADSEVKLAAVEPYLNQDKAVAIVAAHYDEPVAVARVEVYRVEWQVAQAGF